MGKSWVFLCFNTEGRFVIAGALRSMGETVNAPGMKAIKGALLVLQDYRQADASHRSGSTVKSIRKYQPLVTKVLTSGVVLAGTVAVAGPCAAAIVCGTVAAAILPPVIKALPNVTNVRLALILQPAGDEGDISADEFAYRATHRVLHGGDHQEGIFRDFAEANAASLACKRQIFQSDRYSGWHTTETMQTQITSVRCASIRREASTLGRRNRRSNARTRSLSLSGRTSSCELLNG